jgi:hypothetical protein
MLEVDGSHGTERRDEGHDRWLGMQSAYAEYRRASAAFECALQFADDSTASERIRLTILERQQRVAFEHYVEARMEFLEFQFDGNNWPGNGSAAPPKREPKVSRFSSWLAFANRTRALQILAVILLCTIAFSLIREQKHRRGLEATRNQPEAKLNQTRDGVQLFGQKLDNGIPSRHSAIRDVGHTPSARALRTPATTPHTTARKPPVERQRRHEAVLRVQPKQAGAKQELVPATQNQRIGTGAYYRFSLARFRQFKHVGPIKISLWSVDWQRRSVRLSIHSNSMQIDVTRLQGSQPVWINVGYSEQPVKVVVDRIAGNRVDGHVVEPRNNKADLTASRFRSTLPASP